MRRVHPGIPVQAPTEEPGRVLIDVSKGLDGLLSRKGSPDSTYGSDCPSIQGDRRGSCDSGCEALRSTLSTLEKKRAKMDHEIDILRTSIALIKKRRNSQDERE